MPCRAPWPAVLLALAVLTAPAAAEAPPAAAGEPANVILVLDASGSMWGQIDGRTKIEIAREAAGNLVAGWNPRDRLGLVAYGHREKGDCADIEVVQTPGTLDPADFMARVEALNPKGKTPLTDAVRKAAGALKSSEQKATVILVSDGEETCDADPCAAGRELEASGVDFTAHVIGFDIADAKTQEQLRCLADATGGRFVLARDAAALNEALSETLAATIDAPPVPQVPAAQPAATFAARLTPDGAVLTEGVAWTLHAAGPDGGRAERAAFSYAAEWSPAVPPGAYVLEVRAGQVTRELAVTVGEAPERTEVVLDAGWLSATARETEESDPYPDDLAWDVYRGGDGRKAGYSYAAAPRWLLPAGDYRVTVKRGQAGAEGTVSVAAGETASLDLVIGAGTLKLSARYAADGPAAESDLAWDVYRSADGRKAGYSYAARPELTLPAGLYRVTVKLGQAAAEREIEVRAGAITETDITLDAGILAVRALFAEGGPEIGDGTSWDVYQAATDLQGRRKKVTYSYSANPEWIVAAGEYAVEVKAGAATGALRVSVSPAQRSEADLVLNAGVVAVTGPGGRGRFEALPAQADLTGRRRALDTANGETAQFILPAGAYVMRFTADGEAIEAPFAVTAGQRSELTLGAP